MARNRTKEPKPAAEENHGGDSGSKGSDTEAQSGNSLSSAAEESSGHSSAAAESGGHSSAAAESGGHSSAAAESGGHSSAAAESGGHSSAEAESGGHSSAAEESGGHSSAGEESSGHSSAAEEEEEEEAEQRDDSDEEQIRQLFEEKLRKKGKRPASNGEASQGKKRGKMEKKESNAGKKKTKGKEIVEEDESKVKFPMNRIYRIMKDQRCSSKIGQETIFLANKAVEKFLELYCREAYACAFLEHKKQITYDHLAAVVSKRDRFNFLADIVPERVKAEDALTEIKEEDE